MHSAMTPEGTSQQRRSGLFHTYVITALYLLDVPLSIEYMGLQPKSSNDLSKPPAMAAGGYGDP